MGSGALISQFPISMIVLHYVIDLTSMAEASRFWRVIWRMLYGWLALLISVPSGWIMVTRRGGSLAGRFFDGVIYACEAEDVV